MEKDNTVKYTFMKRHNKGHLIDLNVLIDTNTWHTYGTYNCKTDVLTLKNIFDEDETGRVGVIISIMHNFKEIVGNLKDKADRIQNDNVV